LWHSQLGRRVTITIRFDAEKETRDYKIARNHIISARKNGLHVICGPDTHSCLVAGTINDDFFLWDPDPRPRKSPIEDILKGKITLRLLFNKHNRKMIELWNYWVDIA
jgi:hypothetical protein